MDEISNVYVDDENNRIVKGYCYEMTIQGSAQRFIVKAGFDRQPSEDSEVVFTQYNPATRTRGDIFANDIDYPRAPPGGGGGVHLHMIDEDDEDDGPNYTYEFASIRKISKQYADLAGGKRSSKKRNKITRNKRIKKIKR